MLRWLLLLPGGSRLLGFSSGLDRHVMIDGFSVELDPRPIAELRRVDVADAVGLTVRPVGGHAGVVPVNGFA